MKIKFIFIGSNNEFLMSDDDDQNFVIDILVKAKAQFEIRMTDPIVCEANRDRSMELAKIAKKALNIMYGSED